MRRDRSQKAIESAIDRLQNGTGSHARHVGIKVRITKQAVAREARVSSATLYRFPDLVERISSIVEMLHEQKIPPAEQRRKKALDEIAELKRQIAALLGENIRLTRLLAKYDPTLGRIEPTSLDAERERRRG